MENLERKSMTWQEEIQGKKIIHEIYCELYGKAKEQGGRPKKNCSQSEQLWSLAKTSQALGQRKGHIAEDLMLAQAVIEDPKLKDCVSKNAAFRQMKKNNQIKARLNEVEKKDIKFNNLILGDAYEKLKGLKDKSVDCVLTDPPYGIDYIEQTNCGDEDEGSGARKIFSVNKNFPDSKEYALAILDKVCKELERVCKDNAHLYFFFAISNYSEFRTILEKYFIVDKVPLIWHKSNFPIGRDIHQNYMLMYETIFFCKNKNTKRILTPDANKKCCENLFKFNIVTSKGHPTQKPVDLLQFLISNSTTKGETVVDPFMGSGSTCIAARKLEREYIGIEREKEYYDFAVSRMMEEQNERENSNKDKKMSALQ
jgi:DNA modification methylase